MRLPEGQVKQAILHPDIEARTAAVFYFSRSRTNDPNIMPVVIQAMERFGWEQAFEFYSFLASLPLTEESFLWVIQELDRLVERGEQHDDGIGSLRHGLVTALLGADPLLLKRHVDRIMDDGILTLKESCHGAHISRTAASARLLPMP